MMVVEFLFIYLFDEEYFGYNGMYMNWISDVRVVNVFNVFVVWLVEVDKKIYDWNGDLMFKYCIGVGMLFY